MPFSFNPLTANFDLVGTSGPAPAGSEYTIERFTLTNTDITNKYIVLADIPDDANLVRLVVIEGIEQDNGVDFQMTPDDGNKRLSWDGLGLESLLANGDKLIVAYNKS